MSEHEAAAVLRWVNWHRKRMDKQPLAALALGECRDPRYCPVARSLGLSHRGGYVEVGRWFESRLGRPHRLPPHVRRFVRDFDEGRYPELVR